MTTTLLRKALRDLRGHIGAYLACAMVMAIGVVFYSSMSQVISNIPLVQQDFYRQYRFADAFAQVNSIPVSRLSRLTAIEGIEKVSGCLTVTSRLVTDSEDENVTLKLISYDPAEADRLNDILVTQGAAPAAGSYDICLNEAFYKANQLKEGDTIELALRGRRVSFSVCGSVQTPEYIYIMPEGSLMPDDKSFGIAYVPLDVLDTLLDRQGEVSDIAFAFERGVVYEDVKKPLETALASSGLIQLIPRADQLSHSMLDLEIESMRSMVGVVPFIFLMVGALIMSVVIKRLVEQQHAQIGLMKAYGYSSREVLGHYAIYGVVIGLLASFIGGGLGALVAGYMAELYSTYFHMPGISGSFSIINVLSLSGLALVFGAGASVYGARGVLKLKAAESMHPPAPPSGKPILLERLSGLWKALHTTTQMSLRNLFRSRLRSVLTWIGLTVCYALIAAVFAFSPMVDVMMTENFTAVQRYDLKAGLTQMTDARSLESALSHMQGVANVEAVLEAPLTLRAGALAKDATLLSLPRGGTLYRLFDDKNVPVAVPEEGVAITYRMAKALGVEIGDRILLDIPYPDKEVYATVSALCEQYTSNYVVIDRTYLASLLHMPQFATSAMIAMAPGDPTAADTLMERLNEASNITSVMSTAQVQQNMNELMQTSMSSLYAMAIMAVFAGFAIVYNASVVILSERIRELASMRVLGFSLGETVRVVALEQLLLCMGGILAGLPLAGATMQALSDAVASDLYAIPTAVPLSSHLTCIVCLLCAWLCAVLITARKVRRTSMADVLKGRD